MEAQPEAERIANTESLFREVNERIAEGASFHNRETDFVCECSDPACTERVEATLQEYEEVREDGATFLLAPGHEDRSIETTVEREDDHAVVEKRHPVVAAIARRLNPRATGAT